MTLREKIALALHAPLIFLVLGGIVYIMVDMPETIIAFVILGMAAVGSYLLNDW